MCLILGDNVFYGQGLHKQLKQARETLKNDPDIGAIVFGCYVDDPERYGVIAFDPNDTSKVIDIIEKPPIPPSNYAVAGLYFYDNQVIEIAKSLTPSARGELEITDVNKSYLSSNKLSVQLLGRGFAWLDTGTPETLLEAAKFVEIIETRQGLKISAPEEIAWRLGYISTEQLKILANDLGDSSYGDYLLSLIEAPQVNWKKV